MSALTKRLGLFFGLVAAVAVSAGAANALGVPGDVVLAVGVGLSAGAVLATAITIVTLLAERFFAAPELRRETTAQSHSVDRVGQNTESFTRAINQLGSPLAVRLGGIYALERIARDLKDDRQVVEVLTAYVREHAPWPPKSSSGTAAQPGSESLAGPIEAIRALERIASGPDSESATGAAEPPEEVAPSERKGKPSPLSEDVQAAMSVLGRRNVCWHARLQPGISTTVSGS